MLRVKITLYTFHKHWKEGNRVLVQASVGVKVL